MRVLRGPHRDWDVAVDATALTIGVYDGVHRGHLAVLGALEAPADGLPMAVVTFEEHPAALLAPDRVPPLLTTTDQKIELLERAGVDMVALLPFDASIASMSAETFVSEVVVDAMAAALVVVGKDFRFGYRRMGDVGLLEQLGVVLGFDAVGLDLQADSGEPVSSSRIRSLIANGDVRQAAALLGRPFALRGTVVPGDARGRTIGVPTANVAFDTAMACPANGVYAVTVSVGEQHLAGVANVGVRPTFNGGGDVVVEAHVLDYSGDLYRSVIEVGFVDRIRNEKRFHNVDELVAQIHRDIDRARALLEATGE
jgi:riboflavin kinase/FMN adenylyltransferase